MVEEWRDLPGYEDRYLVSNRGRIWSKSRDKEMSQRVGTVGYVLMSLRKKGGAAKQKSLHRLVAQAFLPNAENKPQVNHKDGDKQNNCVENLEWVTASENNKHAFKIGHRDSRGEKNSRSKFTEEDILKIRSLAGKLTQREIGEMFGSSRKYIGDIITKRYWAHI